MHASGGQSASGGQPAVLDSAFHKLNGRFGAVPGEDHRRHAYSSVVVKEGGHGVGGVLGMMGIYTPVEATTTPSTSSESTGSVGGGRGAYYQSLA